MLIQTGQYYFIQKLDLPYKETRSKYKMLKKKNSASQKSACVCVSEIVTFSARSQIQNFVQNFIARGLYAEANKRKKIQKGKKDLLTKKDTDNIYG